MPEICVFFSELHPMFLLYCCWRKRWSCLKAIWKSCIFILVHRISYLSFRKAWLPSGLYFFSSACDEHHSHYISVKVERTKWKLEIFRGIIIPQKSWKNMMSFFNFRYKILGRIYFPAIPKSISDKISSAKLKHEIKVVVLNPVTDVPQKSLSMKQEVFGCFGILLAETNSKFTCI